MIFVFESYRKKRQNRVRDWEMAGQAWVGRKNKEYGSDWYDFNDWERGHPKPHSSSRLSSDIVIPFIVIVLVLGVCSFAVVLAATSDNGHHHSTTQTHDYKPKTGDTVKVVYGTYKDSVGVVVKAGDGATIIKLTNSTWTKAMCNASTNCTEGGGVDNGGLLSVNSFDNLVRYRVVK